MFGDVIRKPCAPAPFRTECEELDQERRDIMDLIAMSTGDELQAALWRIRDLAGVPSSAWALLPSSVPTLGWSTDFARIPERAAAENNMALMDAWRKKHIGIIVDQLPSPGAEAPRRQPQPHCWRAGMCVCRGRGIRVKRMKKHFDQHLRAVFDDTRYPKKMLLEGFLICEFLGTNAAPIPGDAADDGDHASDAAVHMAVHTSYFHIGLHYQRPFESTFLKLRSLDPGDDRHLMFCVSDPCGPAVEDMPWCSVWEAIASFDLRRKWSVRFLALRDSLGVLGRPFRPGVVEACVLEHTTETIWKGSTAERPVRRRPRRQQQDEDDHADDADRDRRDGESSNSEAGTSSASSSPPTPPPSPGVGGEVAGHGAAANDDDIAELLEAEESAAALDELFADVGSRASTSDSSDVNSDDYRSVASSDLAILSCGSDPPPDDDHDDDDDENVAEPRQPYNRHPAAGLDVYRGSEMIFGSAIKFNPRNREFYAVCTNTLHGRCIATRTCKAGRRSAQGRPLGFLAAWLLASGEHETKQSHMQACRPTWAERRAARRDLFHPEQRERATLLAAEERVPAPGEASEPEDCV